MTDGSSFRGRRARARGHLRRGVAAVLMLAIVLLGAPSAAAQSPEVVAEGLNGPQDVIVGPDGALWIIDGGVGGDEVIEVFDPEAGGPVEAGLGRSAQVVRVDLGSGEATQIATLPSFATEGGVTGGGGLVAHGDTIYASVGEWIAINPSERPEGVGAVWAIDGLGDASVAIDTFAHEAANDPYAYGPPSSHPYGMYSGPDGSLWVVDAAGNSLLSVDVASGEITTAAVFEPLPGVFPRPDYGGEMLTDPVPTAVTVGADGATYVSLLSGAPFVPGSAKVVAVEADGGLRDFATGLTMLTDLATGPDGALYATQFAIFGEQGPDPVSGAVVRIAGLAGEASGSDELPTTGASALQLAVVGTTLIAAGVLVVRTRLTA